MTGFSTASTGGASASSGLVGLLGSSGSFGSSGGSTGGAGSSGPGDFAGSTHRPVSHTKPVLHSQVYGQRCVARVSAGPASSAEHAAKPIPHHAQPKTPKIRNTF